MLLATLNLNSSPASQEWGPGLLLPLSLNLSASAPGDTQYVYTADTLAPTFTEDPVDEVDVYDEYEGFVPSFQMSGDINLIVGVSTSINGVSASANAGAASVSADSAAAVTGVGAVADTNNYFLFRYDYAQSITGVSGTSRVGTAITQVGASIDVPISGAEAYAETDGLSVRFSSSTGVAGVDSTGYAGDVTNSVYLAANPVAASATASVGAVSVTGDALATLSGVSGTLGLGGLIINPGQDGMPVRRTFPGRGRGVRVRR